MKRALLIQQFACAGLGILLLFTVGGCSSGSAGPMTIEPVPENNPPQAIAGPDVTVAVGTTAMLDGSNSYDEVLDETDPGNPLEFTWTLTSRPVGSSAALASANTAFPTIAVDVAGTYVAKLIVSDGLFVSDADSTVITASLNSGNATPVAYAGPDQHPGVNIPVTLDGSSSYDMDDDSLTYHWYLTSKPSGSNASVSDPFIMKPTLTPDVPGVYTVSLMVNDGKVESSVNHAIITAALTNIANAGPDQYLPAGPSTPVTLDADGSYDSTGKSLTYAWTFASRPIGSAATLSDPGAVHPTFTADIEGKYVLKLVVKESQGTLLRPLRSHNKSI